MKENAATEIVAAQENKWARGNPRPHGVGFKSWGDINSIVSFASVLPTAKSDEQTDTGLNSMRI